MATRLINTRLMLRDRWCMSPSAHRYDHPRWSRYFEKLQAPQYSGCKGRRVDKLICKRENAFPELQRGIDHHDIQTLRVLEPPPETGAGFDVEPRNPGRPATAEIATAVVQQINRFSTWEWSQSSHTDFEQKLLSICSVCVSQEQQPHALPQHKHGKDGTKRFFFSEALTSCPDAHQPGGAGTEIGGRCLWTGKRHTRSPSNKHDTLPGKHLHRALRKAGRVPKPRPYEPRINDEGPTNLPRRKLPLHMKRARGRNS